MEPADGRGAVPKRVGSLVAVRGGVGRPSDTPRVADEERDPGNAQRATPFCLQSMESSPHGSASSRSGAIEFPHRSQVPYVPSGILVSARSTSRRLDRSALMTEIVRARSAGLCALSAEPDPTSMG